MFYIRTIYTDCSRAYRILRHVLLFIPQPSLRKRLVYWRRDLRVVWSRWRHVPHHLEYNSLQKKMSCPLRPFSASGFKSASRVSTPEIVDPPWIYCRFMWRLTSISDVTWKQRLFFVCVVSVPSRYPRTRDCVSPRARDQLKAKGEDMEKVLLSSS